MGRRRSSKELGTGGPAGSSASDILFVDGVSLAELPLIERKARLESAASDPVQRSCRRRRTTLPCHRLQGQS
jgi:ATP-dependent DNA ligase